MENPQELYSVVKERDDLRSQNERLWAIVQKQKEIITQLTQGKDTPDIVLPAPIQKVGYQDVTFEEKANKRKSFVHRKAEEQEENELEELVQESPNNSQEQKPHEPEVNQLSVEQSKSRKRIPPVISGTLFKKGNYFGGWKTRFYSLDNSGTLVYADSKEGEVLESISLASCYVVPFYSNPKKSQDNEKHGLVLVEYKKSFFNSQISMTNMTPDGLPSGKIENRHVLFSNTMEERDLWLRSLSLSIAKCRPQDELAQLYYSNTQHKKLDSKNFPFDTQSQSDIHIKAEAKKMEKPTLTKRQSSLSNFKSSDPDFGASEAEWATVDPAQWLQTLAKARSSSIDDAPAIFTDILKEKDLNSRFGSVSLPSIVEAVKDVDNSKKVLEKRSSSLALDESVQISGAMHIRSGFDGKSYSESAIHRKESGSDRSTTSNELPSKQFVEAHAEVGNGHRAPISFGKTPRNDQDQDRCLLQPVPIFLKDELPLLEQRKSDGRSKKTKKFSDWVRRKESGHFSLFGTTIGEATNSTRIQEGYEIPSLMYRCIEYLDAKRAESEEGIYRLSGASSAITAIKATFEKDGDFNLLEVAEYIDPHAVAGLLKSFLRELNEPLFKNDLRAELFKISDVKTREGKIEELKLLVEKLPLANYTCFKVLMGHLLRITQNADKNKMPARNIAIVFSPTLAVPGNLFTLMLAEFSSIFVRKLINIAESPLNIDIRGASTDHLGVQKSDSCAQNPIIRPVVIPSQKIASQSIEDVADTQQRTETEGQEEFGSDIMTALANQLKDLETENQ